MGMIRQGPPEFIILHLLEKYAIPNFVETGTFLGNTTYWASKYFERVFTIEFSEPIYRQAIEKYGDIDNITFLYGHTRAILAEIVPLLDVPSLFWLDAHWSGGQTYGAQDECPVLDEIDIIDQSNVDSFILVDDARLFLEPPPRPHHADQWPDITTIIAKLNQRVNRYIVISEDVIIAVPGFAKAELIGYFQDLSSQKWQETQRRAKKSVLRAQAERVYRSMRSRLRARSERAE